MIEKVTSVTEGVRKLLRMRKQDIPEFTIREKADGEYIDTLIFHGQEIPLFDSRYDNQLIYMEEYGRDTDKNSALNVYSFVGNDVSLNELIFRELFIAELLLHSKIHAITAFLKPNAANLIVVMEDGTAANMDLGNTLSPGSVNQRQHRLITSKGMACDRAAGYYTVESQMNVFRNDSTSVERYDDEQVYLYGLSDLDVQKALTVYSIVSGNSTASTWDNTDKGVTIDPEAWIEAKARYLAAIDAASVSNRTCQTVVLD